MALKLFFRHLFTSIRRRPAQPLLLIVVIALAVTVCITAQDLKTYMTENYFTGVAAEYGEADFVVNVSSASSMRFMFAAEAEKELGDGASVCGTYGLPFFCGEDRTFVYGVATEFAAANEMFDFSFYEVTDLYESDLGKCVFVTESFAREQNLGTGSKIRLDLLGYSAEFTVYGLSKYPFMGFYDMMIDIAAVVDKLAEQSAFIAVTKEDFCPSSSLYVSCDEDKYDETFLALETLYNDMNLTCVNTQGAHGLNAMESIVFLIVLVTVLFAVAVIYCCFNILTEQRKEENMLFAGVGAKPYMLNLISVAEMFLYWLVGGVIGIFASYGVTSVVIKAADLKYCTQAFQVDAILIAVFVVLAASEASMCLYILMERLKKKARRKEKKEMDKRKVQKVLLWVLPVLAAVLIVTTCLVPNDDKIYFGVSAFVILMFMSFYIGKIIFKAVAEKIGSGTKFSIPVRYGIKNAARVESLGNTSGLTALFLLVIVTVTTVIMYGEVSNNRFATMLSGEYMVLNAPSSCVEKLKKVDGVNDVHTVYQEFVPYLPEDGEKETSITVLSASDIDAFSGSLRIPDLPKGEEVYICKFFAPQLGLEIGDEVVLKIGGVEHKLRFTKELEVNGYLFMIDAEYLGIPMNYITVETKPGYSSEKVYENCMEALAFDSVTVIESGSFQEGIIESNESYLLCAYLMSIFLLIFAVIGSADSIVASNRSRRDEFRCYESAGMSKKDVRKMKAGEMAYSFIVGILVMLTVVALLLLLLYEICLSFYMDMTYIIPL